MLWSALTHLDSWLIHSSQSNLPVQPHPRLSPLGIHTFVLCVGVSVSALQIAQRVKRLPTMRETRIQSLGWEDSWRRKWQPTPVF